MRKNSESGKKAEKIKFPISIPSPFPFLKREGRRKKKRKKILKKEKQKKKKEKKYVYFERKNDRKD